MTIDHVGLAVGDLQHMTAWWSAALDAQVEYEVDRSAVGIRGVVLQDASGFRLELLHRDGASPAHGAEGIDDSLLRCGFGHLALGVDDVAADYERLIGLGAASVLTPRAGSRPGLVIAFVADPEHNLIELISRGAG
jgi:glyoxylase I family protein